jgi:hypothetical protein
MVKQLHTRLDAAVARYLPDLESLGRYHWSILQAEYATDIVFRSVEDLAPLYDHLLRTAIHAVKVDDVATFLRRPGVWSKVESCEILGDRSAFNFRPDPSPTRGRVQRENMKRMETRRLRATAMRIGCIVGFFFLVVAQGIDVHAQTSITQCGVRLTIPRAWTFRPMAGRDGACRFGILPKNWSTIRKTSSFDFPDYPIVVTVDEGSFDEAVVDAGFLSVGEMRRREGDPTLCSDLAPDRWLIVGGKGSLLCDEAKEITTGQGTGIGACTSYGRMRKRSGGYAGLGEACTAVVNIGGKNLTVDGTEVDYDGVLLPLVRSAKIAK